MYEKIIAALKNIELESTNSDLVATCQHVVVSIYYNIGNLYISYIIIT